MNKLKEIGNKFYQEVEVVMLATEKATWPNCIWLGKISNQLRLDTSYNHKPKSICPIDNSMLPQHLYFLSNEKIKVDDWCFEVHNGPSKAPKDTPRFTDKDDNIWWLRQMNMNCSANDPECKKIIATTDKLMNNDLSHVPQPSQSFIQAFIKAYNEGKPITKVLVEMEGIGGKMINNKLAPVAFKLKVNSSNEMTIKKIKDSYTREELESAYHYGRLNSVINIPEFNKWVQEIL